ncbi:MAG: 30S ribosomal protein S4e [Euryarchaeota archaeon]|nr:30S ribosomal protein S4e [Euryarchaeota archaeon]
MSKHLKRLAAPRTWPIKRKVSVWVPKPSPGPHGVERSVPLYLLMRDMLNLCGTAREAKRIIGQRQILVDGKIATDPKLPVGLMDVVSVPKTKEHFRMMLNKLGVFSLVRIDDASAKWKLARVERKVSVRGGKMQLGLHDGRCAVVEKTKVKTGDTLKIEVPSQKVLGVYALDKGNMAMLVAGLHVGELHAIEGYKVTRNPKANMVTFADGLSTVKGNVFVVGKDAPEVKMPEVSAL